MEKQFSALKRGIFFLALVFTTIPVFSQSKLLTGSWRLTAADKILPDGSQVADFGTAPHGIAIFTADGHYVVEIFRSDRIKFASGDRAKGTPEEYKDAVLSASCHFGTYSVDAAKGTITFHLDRASYPNWDETTRVSSFKLEGDKLTWRVPPRPDGSIPVSIFNRMP
jgi:hypothetical protein